jgi:hypothetical protein
MHYVLACPLTFIIRGKGQGIGQLAIKQKNKSPEFVANYT